LIVTFSTSRRVLCGLPIFALAAVALHAAPPVPTKQVEYVITGTRIVAFDNSGNYQLQFGGTGTGNGLFQLPSGIAVDPGNNNVWVSDAVLNRVQEFSSTGTYITQFGGTGTSAGQLLNPYGLTVDASGNVWVADTGNNRIQEFSSSGAFVQTFGSLGGGNGQFVGPVGIACFNTNGSSGPCNALDISDTGNNRIQQFTLNTSPPTFAAAFGAPGTGQGQFRGPFAVATEPGLVFVADPYNQRIQMFFDSPGSLVNGYWITSSGLYSTSYVFTYPSPYGVAVDGNGLVWTTDYNANKVVAFGNNLALPILVGPFGVTGGGPGQLFHPTYIAIGAIPDNT